MTTRLVINGRVRTFAPNRNKAVSTEILPVPLAMPYKGLSDYVVEDGIRYRYMDNPLPADGWVEVQTLMRWLGVSREFIKKHIIAGDLDPAMKKHTAVPLVRIKDKEALIAAADKNKEVIKKNRSRSNG